MKTNDAKDDKAAKEKTTAGNGNHPNTGPKLFHINVRIPCYELLLL